MNNVKALKYYEPDVYNDEQELYLLFFNLILQQKEIDERLIVLINESNESSDE